MMFLSFFHSIDNFHSIKNFRKLNNNIVFSEDAFQYIILNPTNIVGLIGATEFNHSLEGTTEMDKDFFNGNIIKKK